MRLAPGAALPDALRARATEKDGFWHLRLGGLAEVEAILAALRTAACAFDDLRLTQADLEDVFIGLMQGAEGAR